MVRTDRDLRELYERMRDQLGRLHQRRQPRQQPMDSQQRILRADNPRLQQQLHQGELHTDWRQRLRPAVLSGRAHQAAERRQQGDAAARGGDRRRDSGMLHDGQLGQRRRHGHTILVRRRTDTQIPFGIHRQHQRHLQRHCEGGPRLGAPLLRRRHLGGGTHQGQHRRHDEQQPGAVLLRRSRIRRHERRQDRHHPRHRQHLRRILRRRLRRHVAVYGTHPRREIRRYRLWQRHADLPPDVLQLLQIPADQRQLRTRRGLRL